MIRASTICWKAASPRASNPSWEYTLVSTCPQQRGPLAGDHPRSALLWHAGHVQLERLLAGP